MTVTPADDSFHPAATDDPLWTETAWFAFAVPERSLAGTIYPMFRPNLGVCALSVFVWDASAHEPWRVPYGRSLWHLPMPERDLTELSLAGLEYTRLAPLSKYRVQYADGDRIALDLVYEGLIPAHGLGIADGRGHIDQPCRVNGRILLAGEEIAVDGFEMRDRSWNVRDDRRPTRASYSYGIASADDNFLAMGFYAGDDCKVVAGFLVRDGEQADLVSGTRRVVERAHGYPVRVALDATDRLGRRLETEGRTLSRLAQQATPGMFAWMSLIAWDLAGATVHGEDQDVSSPDQLPLR
jgi:hypothetical protein